MVRRKAQIVILVDPDIRDQLDMLRIIDNTSRARVIEPMLKDSIANALAMHPARVAQLHALAKRADMTVEKYVQAYAAAYMRMTYSPTLADLEKDDRAITGRKRKPASADAA